MKQPCHRCGKNTRKENENGQPCCSDCQEQEKIEKMVKEKLAKEVTRTCPACQTEMAKVTYPEVKDLTPESNFIIIDKCPNCRSVFLDCGEMKKITKMLEEEAEDNASCSHSSGFASGFIIGSVIN